MKRSLFQTVVCFVSVLPFLNGQQFRNADQHHDQAIETITLAKGPIASSRGTTFLAKRLQSATEVTHELDAKAEQTELSAKKRDTSAEHVVTGSQQGPSTAAVNSHRIDCVHSRTADLVCANFPRPHIGHCLHGQARTLTHPLVYRTVRSHVIEAIGGDLVSFASVILPSPDADHWYPHRQNESAVKEALEYMGIGPGQMRLIREGEPGSTPVLPACFNAALADGQAMTLAAQLANRAQCLDLMEAHENLVGRRFDYMLVHRADLTWAAPMMPHCLIGAKLKHFLMTSDFVQMMPREIGQIVFREMANAFNTCSQPYVAGDYCELWEFRYLQGRQVTWVDKDPNLPCYPLRSAELLPLIPGLAQLDNTSQAWTAIIAPDIDSPDLFPQLNVLNTCNHP